MKINFKNKFNNELKQFPFVIVDVGARTGPKKEWFPIRNHLKLVGFEPCKDEYKKLKESAVETENITYIDSACYDRKTSLVLHIAKDEGLSSVFMPNYDFLRHFPESNTSGYKIKDKITIDAEKLDNMLPEAIRQELDFLKIDVEGCAFEVIKGAEATIKNGLVVGLRVEAEFNEKYKGQNLFSGVDLLLREHGYQLFDIKTCHWKRSPGTKTGGTRGQLVHGDFIYFINANQFFERIQGLSPGARTAKIIKFIIICCIYGCYDFALELLHESCKRKFIDNRYHGIFQRELAKTSSIFMRLPKLKGRGKFRDLLYHIYMICYGTWLARTDFYEPIVEL